MSQYAVVTGGASGIGFEVARQLAGTGLGVAILDLNVERAESAAANLGDGAKVLAIGCDVADLASVEAAADRIHAAGGHVSHVISNAGWGPNKRFLDTPVADQQRIIDVNFGGALNVCRVFLPEMCQARWGRVVLVGSDAGRIGTPKEAVYAGAKAALIGFAKSLAVEVARDGVTVNVVSPGSTDTEFFREILTEDQVARRIKSNPMGRIGAPADVAAAILFFCADSAGYISGQVLSVNGGMSRLG